MSCKAGAEGATHSIWIHFTFRSWSHRLAELQAQELQLEQKLREEESRQKELLDEAGKESIRDIRESDCLSSQTCLESI